MFYDAQVAGLPDAGPHPHDEATLGAASWGTRRAAVVTALRRETDLRFVNAGGTGSLHRFGSDRVVTGLAPRAPGSTPTLFDGYDDFTPRPTMAFALPVVRRPAPGLRHGLRRRLRREWRARVVAGAVAGGRGLKLVRTEATGEVQTPLHGEDADGLRIGDRVWMRGAKAGELLERFDAVHLVAGGELVGTVPSYRGEGRNFG